MPHKHILTWRPSGTDTLSFLDGGDGNSIEREGMVGLFECGVRIGGVPHFYNLGLAWCRPPKRRQNPLCRPPGGRHGMSTSRRSTRHVDHRIGDTTHCVDLSEVETGCGPPKGPQGSQCRPPGGRHKGFCRLLLFLYFGVRILNTFSDVSYFTYFVTCI